MGRSVVLLILLFFSLFSWALIFQKLRLFSRARAADALFLRVFRSNRGFPTRGLSGCAGGSPLEVVYAAGYRELRAKLMGTAIRTAASEKPECRDRGHAMAAADEVRKMERYMPWLATTGSVTPFIGLFGTVLGRDGRVLRTGHGGGGEPARGRARHRRSADHHGGGAFHRDSRRDRLQPFLHNIRIWARAWTTSPWKSPR